MSNSMNAALMLADLMCYLEDDVAISFIELPMESFIHLEGNKVFYLPHCHTRNLSEDEKERHVN